MSDLHVFELGVGAAGLYVVAAISLVPVCRPSEPFKSRQVANKTRKTQSPAIRCLGE